MGGRRKTATQETSVPRGDDDHNTMEVLQRRWTAIKARVTTIINRVQADGVTEENVSMLSERVDSVWSELEALHNRIIDETNDEDLEARIEEFSIQENRVMDLKILLAKIPVKTLNDAENKKYSASSEVKLPALELPTFGGDITDWAEFADLFRAGIEENPTLSNAQKLQYLKGALKGEAAKMIKHMPITDANYQKAWELLKARYEKRRETANTLARKMINLPDVKNGKASLRNLLDTFYEAEGSLEAIIQNDSPWDLLIINIITKFLDYTTIEAWELSLTTNDLPSLKEFLQFLEIRARACNTHTVAVTPTEKTPEKKSECPICKAQHFVRNCPKFEKSNVQEKRELAEKYRLCFNCLSTNHRVMDCKSLSRCRKCQKTHHTSLHQEKMKTSNLVSATQKFQIEGESLLPTAIIEANNRGKSHQLRALLDSGSQFNVISDRMVKKLGLQKRRAVLNTNTLAGTCELPHQVSLKVQKGIWEKEITCYVTDKLNFSLPSTTLEKNNWEHIKDLELADPEYYKPRPIDLILGINFCSEVKEDGFVKGVENKPSAQKTVLGWTLGGPTGKISSGKVNLLCTEGDEIRKFWEIEDVPQHHILSEEEAWAETHFKNSIKRLSNGAYEVKYPFFEEKPSLGDSRDQAVTRYLRLEKQLEKKNKKTEYDAVLQEYLDLGHMKPLTEYDKHGLSYYLPHHAVFKDSTTTKLRVVFDASAKTTNGKSLNDTMMNGPKCQDDLFHILLRFQKHSVAICADIEKMYRQIRINPSHQNLQRIIWRKNVKERLQEFKLTTVTFGMKASPFLATRTLQQLAQDEGESFPEAKRALQQDFYVDDLMTGANSLKQAQMISQELDNLLRAGGFKLRKWCSNEPSLMKTFEEKNMSGNVSIGDETIKTLGLQWKPSKDTFIFKVNIEERKTHTKRTLLSDISRIFDPLGWLSPITIVGKMIFQELWLLPVTWDQELPKEILERWKNYRRELTTLEKIEIPRYLHYEKPEDLMLCGFCDASEKAYGAVIYLRSNINNQIRLKLLLSKSRVTPLKPMTIPRLELCAAVLLARLMNETKKALKMEIPSFYWSDSSVVLHWITQHPSRWKTFVSHRVAEIQNISEPSHWFHVATKDNPADLISRGTSAQTLQKTVLWWRGPTWLQEPHFKKRVVTDIQFVPEERRQKAICSLAIANDNFCSKFSNLSKLMRITATMIRFIQKTRKQAVLDGPIRVSELREALLKLIHGAQCEYFSKEIEALKKKEKISKKSSILSLTPFIDNKGLLRVGGRLLHADLNYDQKHQILLPYEHWITTLIIEDIHIKNGHAGNELTLATLRQRYWLPKAKQRIRRIIHKCVICIRYKAQIQEQLMGQLPRDRVTPIRPFLKTGVDYCGPIICKEIIGRCRKTHKAYVAVFVCMATKAIHLEAVTSLSMESFLAALTRFISRRGLPSDIYSDNGKNFVATNSHLRTLYKMLQDETNVIHKRLAEKGIQWHFIPPYAPHFGGLWEAGVKSFKFHFRRIMGNETLNFEELSTILCKIEMYLNSRPLCPMSTDVNDLEVLTPGHFLIGAPLNAIPESTNTSPKLLSSRFQLLQKLSTHFWKIWQKTYLSTLQVKTKWKLDSQPILEGDLVLIKEPNLPPRHWKLGRVTSTSKDDSGRARVFQLRTAGGATTRTLPQIVKLFSTTDESVQD